MSGVRWCVLLVVFTACGDDGSVSPSEATAADLYGQWERPIGGPNAGRVFSFRETGQFHPALAGKTNVFVSYDYNGDSQIPLIMGTYRVEDGVIVQTPVWVEQVGTVTNAAELRNDLLSLTKGSKLTIEGGDGMPSVYEHLDGCRVPAQATAWRYHTLGNAVWDPVLGSQRHATTMTFDADDQLVVTAAGLVARYDDDCIPEVGVNTAPDTSGESWVVSAADGTHVVAGRSFGANATATTYAKLGPGMLTFGTRAVPIDGREILDVADLGGKVGILVSPLAGGLVLVHDDGASLTQTPVTNLPIGFTAAQLIDGGGGRAVILGTGSASGQQRMFLVEETAPAAFTATQVPVDSFASYLAAASENGDLWIVYAVGLAQGNGAPHLLHLATRRGGTWTTRPTVIGTRPELVVHNGVAHLATLAFTNGMLQANTYYTRIEGEQVTSWIVPPHGGTALSPLGGPVAAPSIAVAEDGRVAVGFQSRFHLRVAGEHDARLAPVTVNITGNGRVTSSDGLIDCTASCTAMAEVGTRLLFKATATNAGATYIGCGSTGGTDQADPTVCNADVLQPMGTPPVPFSVTANVMFP